MPPEGSRTVRPILPLSSQNACVACEGHRVLVQTTCGPFSLEAWLKYAMVADTASVSGWPIPCRCDSEAFP